MISRRALGLAPCLILLAALQAQIKIHLIGTGGPEVTAALLLFDARRGARSMESINPACGPRM